MTSLFRIALWALAVLRIGIDETVAITGVKWNKRLRVFEPIPGVTSYEDEKKQRILQSRQEETHDFNGESLTIMYFEEPGFFEFYDNDTKARGVCGEIWTILSQSLNFTLILNKVDRPRQNYRGEWIGGFNKVIRLAKNNSTDIIPKIKISRTLFNVTKFTPVLWANRMRIFARPYWKGKRGWMFDIFSMEVWNLILTVIGTLSLANVMTQKVLTRNRVLEVQDRSYLSHLFYTFATLCNQGNAPDNTGSGSRMLRLTVSVFCWLTLVSHGACLIQGITKETIDAPFNDFATLFENTDLKILVVAGSIGHSHFTGARKPMIYRTFVEANRLSVEPTLDDTFWKVCSHPDKYVLYEEEDAVKTMKMANCRLYPFDNSSPPMYVASGISGKVKNKRSLDIAILKLRETGVIDRLKNRYMSSKIVNFAVRQTIGRTQSIDIHRVSIIFLILVFGILASIVICVIENIVFKIKNCKNVFIASSNG